MLNPHTISGKLFELGLDYHPVAGMVELTRRCNLTCGYCYHRQERINDTADLPTTSVFKIIDKLYDIGILGLCFTGGEPFIREDILDILEHTRSKGFFTCTFLSNGSMLTDQHIRYLGQHCTFFPTIKFSVYSHIPELHDNFVGYPGHLKRLIENGKKLQDAGIIVHVAFNILDFNVASFAETIDYFKSQGFYLDYGLEKVIEPATQDVMRLNAYTTQSFYSSFLNHATPGVVAEHQKKYAIGHSQSIDQRPCTGLITSITIDSDGGIKPCLGFRKLIIGNAVTDSRSLRDILIESDEYRSLRDLKKTDIPLCRECRHNNFCAVCIGMMHSTNGDFSTPPAQTCNYACAVESKFS